MTEAREGYKYPLPQETPYPRCLEKGRRLSREEIEQIVEEGRENLRLGLEELDRQIPPPGPDFWNAHFTI